MKERNQLLEDTKHDLASNIRKLRTAHGVSQEKLAEQAGLHRTYLSRVERETANITLENLVNLAALLDVLPHDLLKPGSARERMATAKGAGDAAA